MVFRNATIKQIEIVGEACNHLSKELKLKYPELEWTQINGFRNISIHEYCGINLHIVWDVAKEDLPLLKVKFNEILRRL
jgi:uncharacterized protein with HEPN domain